MSPIAELLDVRPERFLRRLPERDVFLWPLAGHGEVVVKRARERCALLRASAGEVELENLRALAADGLPVPRALGSWTERRAPFARRSLVIMERVEHAQTLRERLSRAASAERARWASAVLDIVVRLHARGWYHRDLYLQHFVLRGRAGAEELVLLDVGRARRGRCGWPPRARWFVKDLAALAHSAPKAVSVRERLRFLALYLDRRGITGRARRRRWARAIAAKARRIAAHVPRYGDPAAFHAESRA